MWSLFPYLLWFISPPPLPPVLIGCWKPLAVPHSAVVCLILPSSGDGNWVTRGSPLVHCPLLVSPRTQGPAAV